MSEYAYIYNVGGKAIPIGADIPFDSDGVTTSGITHAPGAAPIVILTGGDYRVAFSVSGTEPNQMALFLNGAFVSGAVYGSGAGTQQNGGQAILSISAGDVLTLRNHASAAAVGLQASAGGTAPNVNASVSIEKVGP